MIIIGKDFVLREVCVETCTEAIKAEHLGADRIELCKRLDLGGVTPGKMIIEETLSSISVPVKVMIRPREGNFVYHEKELLVMEKEIDLCKSTGVKEVVFGLLTNEGNIDIASTRRLAVRAYPMAVTFHKAIDVAANILYELERLSSIPEITSILTSGGKKTAEEGCKEIREIIQRFGSRFKIIAAGSITDQNINDVHSKIFSAHYHGRNIVGKLT